MHDLQPDSAGTNRLTIDAIVANGLTVEPLLDGRTLHVRLRGVADGQMMSRLASFLNRLHVEARRLRVAEVRVDFRQLEFMDSSCFKAFVTWLALLGDLEPASQYPIRFLSNPANHWQRKTLHALSAFARNLACVET
jgi:hypothetical protein